MKELSLVMLALLYSSYITIAIRNLASKHTTDRAFVFVLICVVVYTLLGNLLSK